MTSRSSPLDLLLWAAAEAAVSVLCKGLELCNWLARVAPSTRLP